MKKLISLLVLVLVAVMCVGCKKQDKNPYGLVEEGYLTVATSSDFAPFEFVDLTKSGQDKFVGSDMALAKYIASEMKLKLKIKAMDFESLLTALDSGKADIAIAGFSYTEDRAAYLFTSCYYGEGDGGQVIVTTKANASKYNSLETLNVSENKIAAQSGALQLTLVQEQLPQANLIAITDLNNALTLVKNGTYDSIAIASTVAQTWVAADDNLTVCATFDFEDTGSYAIAAPTKMELVKAINPIIEKAATAQANGKTMYETWKEEAEALFVSLGDNASEANPEEGDLD